MGCRLTGSDDGRVASLVKLLAERSQQAALEAVVVPRDRREADHDARPLVEPSRPTQRHAESPTRDSVRTNRNIPRASRRPDGEFCDFREPYHPIVPRLGHAAPPGRSRRAAVAPARTTVPLRIQARTRLVQTGCRCTAKNRFRARFLPPTVRTVRTVRRGAPTEVQRRCRWPGGWGRKRARKAHPELVAGALSLGSLEREPGADAPERGVPIAASRPDRPPSAREGVKGARPWAPFGSDRDPPALARRAPRT